MQFPVIKYTLLLFSILLSAGSFNLAPHQFTSAQTATARNQAQNQQGQQGLSPEKKKSLSKYGPEDVFPGETDNENAKQPARAPRGGSPSKNSSRTTAGQNVIEAPTPSPSVSKASMSQPRAGPSPVAEIQTAATNKAAQRQSSTINRPFIFLAILSIVVLLALVYSLIKLAGKLREG